MRVDTWDENQGPIPVVARLLQKVQDILPEQRLFLKSDDGTRFMRLSTGTQVGILGGSALVLGWTIFSTSVLLMDSLNSGSARDQALREQAMYGARLNDLSLERDTRAEEARKAQERFYIAMAQISAMQQRLLESEERRSELETGIDAIHATLQTAMRERDDAIDRAELVIAELEQVAGTRNTQAGMLAAKVATIEALSDRLMQTAEGRDTVAQHAETAQQEVEELIYAAKLAEERTERILDRLEEAATASLEPLEQVLQQAELPADRIIETVRRTYTGQGGPLVPLSVSTRGPNGEDLQDPLAERANTILSKFDELNLHRMATDMLPFYQPVQSSYRFTSGFGYRRDPKTGGRRMHNGTDFAAPVGTPLLAAGDGVVIQSGWAGGYGRMITIQHEFGYTTRYAHLSRIRVSQGQRVSRGDRIGDMGSSGRSTGSHLHYEVRLNGTPVNPMTFIRAGQNVF